MTSTVAVITPVFREHFSPDEQLSLSFLRQHLGRHRRIIIAPEGLHVSGLDDFHIVRFPSRFFQSVQGYTALMLSRRFYRTLAEFEFLLVYQLDALVFRDELEAWCAAGYDYVGAPIEIGTHWGEQFGLNGGFSLRRIEAFLRVLTGRGKGSVARTAERMIFMQRNASLRACKRVLLELHQARILNALPIFVRKSGYPEDLIWSEIAPLLDPTFRVAPAVVAQRFAFETRPSHYFEETGRVLPFGCHAWKKWDPSFWQSAAGI